MEKKNSFNLQLLLPLTQATFSPWTS